jgi:predicted RNA polymerase sigma factor
MELQASRLPARQGPGGEAILLLDQDRSQWDRVLVHRGLTALARAGALAQAPGSYQLQASIAACHARAATPTDTNWPQIVLLYSRLAALAPSPVVELNRAVAVGMAFGAAAGLHLVDQLTRDPTLHRYHLLPSVRGDLLARLGRHREAQAEFLRAAALAHNERERQLLQVRAAASAHAAGGG